MRNANNFEENSKKVGEFNMYQYLNNYFKNISLFITGSVKIPDRKAPCKR